MFTVTQKVALILTAIFSIFYSWSYLHLRQTKVIVHYHQTCEFFDQVEAGPTEGPHSFARAFLRDQRVETILVEETESQINQCVLLTSKNT